jgi:tryptophan-rich sensory protein
MGYASYLVGKTSGWGSRPMVLYGAQLALNLAWQPLFFLAKRPGVAQIDNAGASTLAAANTACGGDAVWRGFMRTNHFPWGCGSATTV